MNNFLGTTLNATKQELSNTSFTKIRGDTDSKDTKPTSLEENRIDTLWLHRHGIVVGIDSVTLIARESPVLAVNFKWSHDTPSLCQGDKFDYIFYI